MGAREQKALMEKLAALKQETMYGFLNDTCSHKFQVLTRTFAFTLKSIYKSFMFLPYPYNFLIKILLLYAGMSNEHVIQPFQPWFEAWILN